MAFARARALSVRYISLFFCRESCVFTVGFCDGKDLPISPARSSEEAMKELAGKMSLLSVVDVALAASAAHHPAAKGLCAILQPRVHAYPFVTPCSRLPPAHRLCLLHHASRYHRRCVPPTVAYFLHSRLFVYSCAGAAHGRSKQTLTPLTHPSFIRPLRVVWCKRWLRHSRVRLLLCRRRHYLHHPHHAQPQQHLRVTYKLKWVFY
jgi:hypothetical protein